MPISGHQEGALSGTVTGPEAMLHTIQELGIVPFFSNAIPGFSIEERTPGGFWFDDVTLGPWDWKIPVIESGEIAYGKFILGGKSCFATAKWYRELMNYRRSLEKYASDAPQQKVMSYVNEHGAITIKEVRSLLGIKKNAADSIVTKLMMQTRLVTGAIQRVYRGPDLHYNGWQVSSFCKPDDLFGTSNEESSKEFDLSFSRTFKDFPFSENKKTKESAHSPSESFDLLFQQIKSVAPKATDAEIRKILG